MSEYQYVAFRAVDKPVSDIDLEYMNRQSSRAEIDKWSFENEYNYSEFRGDALEMLRRGYDIHLLYANYGTRSLMIRIPDRQAIEAAVATYFDEESLKIVPDKTGPGGSLCLHPIYDDPGYVQELYDVPELFDRLIPLREEILNGDLRPLYLAHLAISHDGMHDRDESVEGPVPAGLDSLTDAQIALAQFYDLSDDLIAAAADGIPRLEELEKREDDQMAWIRDQPQSVKDDWLGQLLTDSGSVMATIKQAYRASRTAVVWPVLVRGRTIAELDSIAEQTHETRSREAQENAARAKAERLEKFAADPSAVLQETETLVAQRSGDAYSQIADLLSDLREALAGTDHAGLAEQQARKLRAENSSCRGLIPKLRAKGLIGK